MSKAHIPLGWWVVYIEEVDWKANKKYIMHNLKNLILE